MASLSTPRQYPAGAAVAGRVYVSGGHSSQASGLLEALDPQTSGWSARPLMPTPRYLHAFVEAGGKLYAIGGYDGTNYYNTVRSTAINTENGALGKKNGVLSCPNLALNLSERRH